MTLCAQCGKRLLSQASARCNWCGAIIDNAVYQAQAQTERDAYFRHAAVRDAQSLAAMEALAILGTPMNPWTLAPVPGRRRMPATPNQEALPPAPSGTSAHMPAIQAGSPPAGSDATSEPVKNEAEEAGERFRHLEI